MFKTINPKPDFPKQEEEVLEYWQKENTFEKSLQNREGKETFVFYEGPPTANGKPGIHHVLARAFKDAVCRFQTMRGKYVVRKAGWDTHGLPVELEVEKKLGISGKPQIENIVEGDKRASIAKFNELCRESVWNYKNDWEQMTDRMGYWVDMSDPYVTYDPRYIESIWWVLKQIWDKGLIYLGHKVVPYCPRCGTALSSHEVAQGYEEVEDTSVYVKFKLKAGQKIGDFEVGDNTYVLSWTTTPWTLPGNVALAVGEDIEYGLVRHNNANEYYLVARDFVVGPKELPKSMTEELLNWDHSADFKGSELVGLEYEPLFPGAIPEDQLNENAFKVYAADFVTTEDGTGVVHTAVMYGEDDYQLGEKVGLPKYHTVDENGHFNKDIPDIGGFYVKANKTEKAIIEHLQKNNLFLKEEKHTHTYPFCWRCKSPLLYYARDSWYIRMSDLREKLLENNKKIKWVPEHIQDGRFGEWLREVKDWAISRERYWGTPLPFWQCKDCGEYKVVASLDELGEEGVDPHRPYIDDIVLHCDKCEGEAHRVAEVLDVWFDSGSMPYSQWHYPYENKELIDERKQFPASYIAEGLDQTRGWFYTMHAIATALDLGPAYLSCISHGLVLDDNGQKMSKSKGNIVVPTEVFEKFGADAVRWYFYTVNQPGENKLFAQDDLAVSQRKTFGIMWNVLNYFVTYANASGWDYDDNRSPDLAKNSPNVLDQWLKARLQKCINDVTRYTEDLNITSATRAIEDFAQDFSTWYLRRSRGREDENFFASMYRTLIYTAKLMAPFAPFFAENIYQVLYTDKNYPESVHLSDWPESKDMSKEDEKLLADMVQVRDAAEAGNALRKNEGVKVRQPLSSISVIRNESSVDWSEDLARVLLDELNVKEMKEVKDMKWHESGSVKVGIDFTITPQLQREGDVRELERAVQNLRKQAGLNVGDPAKLYFQADEAMVNELDDERLGISEKEGKKADLETETEVEISTGKVWLGLEKL